MPNRINVTVHLCHFFHDAPVLSRLLGGELGLEEEGEAGAELARLL